MAKKSLLFLFSLIVSCALAGAVDFESLPNPLTRVKAGQWVSYRLLGGVEQKQTVVSVTRQGGDTVFVVKYETADPAYDIPVMEETFTVGELTQAFRESLTEGDATVSRVTVTAAGRELDAVLVTLTDEDGDVIRSYISDQVPITGLIRMEDDDPDADEDEGPLLEIIDWGE